MQGVRSWRQLHACQCRVQGTRARCHAPAHPSFSDTDKGVPVVPTSHRRQLLMQCTLVAPLLVLGTDDAATVVNSVLSAYGLPTLPTSADFRLYDEFQDDFQFFYPRSWIARPNTLRRGVYISDFQTADKLQVEVLDFPADGDPVGMAVAAAVVPGGMRQQSNRLDLPSMRSIKRNDIVLDGQPYTYVSFPSETTTRSGYQVQRKHYAVFTVKRGHLYTLSARVLGSLATIYHDATPMSQHCSARSDQFNQRKKEILLQIVSSFRVR